MEESSGKALRTWSQATSKGMPSATSSPGLRGGAKPSKLRASPKISQSGPEAAPASPSQQQGSKRDLATSAISGLSGSVSSGSAALQSSLESRLRANLEGLGSPEYSLTWKHWDIGSRGRICALRAYLRRSRGKDCSGWPPTTPTAVDYKGSGFPRVGRGARNNLRDWFKMNYRFLYPPVKVVAWLMGYTTDHLSCAPTGTQSSRKSQRRS